MTGNDTFVLPSWAITAFGPERAWEIVSETMLHAVAAGLDFDAQVAAVEAALSIEVEAMEQEWLREIEARWEAGLDYHPCA